MTPRTIARHLAAPALAAALATVLAGCGGSETGRPAAPASAPDGVASVLEPPSGEARGLSASPPTAAASEPAALAFTAQTVDGTAFHGASLAGRAAVVWFWAPWCAVCRAEAPEVAAVTRQYAGKVAFLGIGGLGPAGQMREFATATGVEVFPNVVDTDAGLWAGFGVLAQPATAFIRPDGAMDVEGGPMDRADLKAHAAALLR